ncbi:hypothetical protein B0H14DRAFT_2565770 [Mycena olivaceomarginata]|nr:hypothetical protein B0H14DRAFT_2565770 [Mycena olivaceomarginata]
MCRVPAPDDAFPCLSLLAEVLASVSLPGSLDLVSRLLENFNNVVYSITSTDVDISYIEQSIMSAVEHSAEKITEAPNLAPSAIRLDIVVHFIRVSKSFKRDFLRVFTDASITYRVTVARGPLHRCVGAAFPCPKRRHRIIMAVPSQNAWRSTCTRVHSHLQYNEAVATPQHRRHGHGRHQGLDVRLRVGMYAEGEPPLVGDGVGKGWGHRSGAYMPISFLGTPALFLSSAFSTTGKIGDLRFPEVLTGWCGLLQGGCFDFDSFIRPHDLFGWSRSRERVRAALSPSRR